MRSAAAHEPYRISILLYGALSSQARKKGSGRGLWESTRSITTFRGQGRNTLRVPSSIIATKAKHNSFQKGRSRGKKWWIHSLTGFWFSRPLGSVWLAVGINGYSPHRDGDSRPRSRRPRDKPSKLLARPAAGLKPVL